MTAKKTRSVKPVTGVPVGSDLQPTDANPHSWLFLTGSNVSPQEDRFMFGVLRPTFRGRANSAVEFVTRKLQPVPSVTNDPRAITAARAEVLLPLGADDRFTSPWELMRDSEEKRPDVLNSLLGYATISEPRTTRLHEQWARCHGWVRRDIVDRFGVAALLVQHAPHRQLSGNPPHIHLLVPGPRKLTSLGWSEAVSCLCNDRGRDVLLGSWQAHIG